MTIHLSFRLSAICVGFLLLLATKVSHAQQSPAASPASSTQINNTTAIPSATPQTASVAVSGDYVLRANDVVSVTVFQEPELACNERLAGDGTISMPLVGRIKVGGLTPVNAANTINAALRKGYLVNPQTTISVTETTKEFVTLLGQVAKPGPIELPVNAKANLLQVIGMAGGFTRIANPSKITIKRSADGREVILQADAEKLSKSNKGDTFLIQAGDVITVKERLF